MGQENRTDTTEESETMTIDGIVKKENNIVKNEEYSIEGKMKGGDSIVKSEECNTIVKKEECSSVKKPKQKGGPKKLENKKKILAYMAEQLQTLDRTHIEQQELAEACGYAKPGSHGFFYAFSDLKADGMVLMEKGKGKLTESGILSVPKENFKFVQPKNNDEKQEYYQKLLRKKCKEGTDEKVQVIFEILSDGKPHTLAEFTKGTGYANLKSKGLGYNIACMEKDLKILKKTAANVWEFTDKCFPKGRPD